MEQIQERHMLCLERMKAMLVEETVQEPFRDFYRQMALFLLETEAVRRKIADGTWQELDVEEMQVINRRLYEDILPGHYETSYANPTYAQAVL